MIVGPGHLEIDGSKTEEKEKEGQESWNREIDRERRERKRERERERERERRDLSRLSMDFLHSTHTLYAPFLYTHH